MLILWIYKFKCLSRLTNIFFNISDKGILNNSSTIYCLKVWSCVSLRASCMFIKRINRQPTVVDKIIHIFTK